MNPLGGSQQVGGSGGGLMGEVKAGILPLQSNVVEFRRSHKRIRDAQSLWVMQRQSKQPNKNYTTAFFSQFL